MNAREIEGVLQSFRRDLPNDSATARAIDAGASMAEISEAAEAEGVHQLAAILFEAEQEEAAAIAPVARGLAETMEERLNTFRADLPETSQTAHAIDAHASWERIASCAQSEGLSELAAVLHEAAQERMRVAAG